MTIVKTAKEDAIFHSYCTDIKSRTGAAIPAQLGALSIDPFSIPAGSSAQSVVKAVICVKKRQIN